MRIKQLKTRLWVITDTHFGHDLMREYCNRPEGFEAIIMNNLLKIPKEDILIHLGDLCMGKDAEMHEKYIQQLECRKWLVLGNHDHKSNHWYLTHGWDFVCHQFKLKHAGKRILFSHIPQLDDCWYDVNIHGHFHNTDHRSHESELVRIKSPKHRLLAIEYTDYKPVLLDNLLTPPKNYEENKE